MFHHFVGGMCVHVVGGEGLKENPPGDLTKADQGVILTGHLGRPFPSPQQTMTVAELIAELQNYPPTSRVLIEGYEGGYCDVTDSRIGQGFMEENYQDSNYFGPHEFNYTAEGECVIPAILLKRYAGTG